MPHSFGRGILSIALLEATDSIYRLVDTDKTFFLVLLGFLISKMGAISLLCLTHRPPE